MTSPNSIVFLVDVDNTLLDNDRIQDDIKRHLDREFGVAACERYWTILEQLFADLGYRDYLGALQRYRVEHPQDIHLLSMSSFLVDYKLRILTAVKKIWGDRVSTIFPRQGQYAHDPKVVAACPPADLTVERIGNLLDYDLPALLAGQQSIQIFPEVKP